MLPIYKKKVESPNEHLNVSCVVPEKKIKTQETIKINLSEQKNNKIGRISDKYNKISKTKQKFSVNENSRKFQDKLEDQNDLNQSEINVDISDKSKHMKFSLGESSNDQFENQDNIDLSSKNGLYENLVIKDVSKKNPVKKIRYRKINSPFIEEYLLMIVKKNNEEAEAVVEDIKPVVEEVKAIAEEIKLVNEEVKSVNVEVKLVNEEVKAIVEEIKPVNEEVKIIVEEIKPVNEEINLVIEEVKPVNEEVKIIVEEINLVIEEIKPVNEEVKLVNEEVKAIVEEIKPVNEEVKPVNEEVKLVVEEVKPVVEEVKPVVEEVKQVVEEVKQVVVEKVKPVVEEVKQVVEEVKPVVEEVKPVVEEVKQVVEEVKQVVEEVKPVTEEVNLIDEEAITIYEEVKPVDEDLKKINEYVKQFFDTIKQVNDVVKQFSIQNEDDTLNLTKKQMQNIKTLYDTFNDKVILQLTEKDLKEYQEKNHVNEFKDEDLIEYQEKPHVNEFKDKEISEEDLKDHKIRKTNEFYTDETDKKEVNEKGNPVHSPEIKEKKITFSDINEVIYPKLEKVTIKKGDKIGKRKSILIKQKYNITKFTEQRVNIILPDLIQLNEIPIENKINEIPIENKLNEHHINNEKLQIKGLLFIDDSMSTNENSLIINKDKIQLSEHVYNIMNRNKILVLRPIIYPNENLLILKLHDKYNYLMERLNPFDKSVIEFESGIMYCISELSNSDILKNRNKYLEYSEECYFIAKYQGNEKVIHNGGYTEISLYNFITNMNTMHFISTDRNKPTDVSIITPNIPMYTIDDKLKNLMSENIKEEYFNELKYETYICSMFYNLTNNSFSIKINDQNVNNLVLTYHSLILLD